MFESEVLSREEGDIWIRGRRLTSTPHRIYTPEEAPQPTAHVYARPLPVRQVPSVVVPQEWNYLLDPEEGVLRAGWSTPKPFRIDPRLLDPGLR